MPEPIVVKKYGNRRLYDTSLSRYVTLDELSARISGGERFRVIDAKSGGDLTAATLTQMIVEGRELSRLLPVPLLEQLIRLGDDALGEFFGTWVSGALELYLQARSGFRSPALWNPLAAAFSPFGEAARAWSPPAPREPTRPPPGHPGDRAADRTGDPNGAGASSSDEVAELRRELEALRAEIRGARSVTGADDPGDD